MQIDLRSVALGRTNGTALISLSDDDHCRNRITTANSGNAQCEVRRFDSLMADDEQLSCVRLVKIDVEGFEMEVLTGMEGVLEKLKQAAFVIEITPQWLTENGSSASDLYRFMREHGWQRAAMFTLRSSDKTSVL